MPQFTFRATDRLGNTVEGAVVADNEIHAMDQVRQMGYNPIGVRPVVAPTVAVSVAPVPTQQVNVAGNGTGRRRPVDLTIPVTEMPAASSMLNMYTGGSPDATMEIEPAIGAKAPWERGGPIAEPEPTVGMTPNTPGATQAMAPLDGNYRGPDLRETPRGLETRRPVSPPKEVPKSLGRRFNEVMIYPIFSGVVLKDLAPFYRQFATLISAGLPMFQALSALEDNTKNGKLKEIVRAGKRRVQAGGSFSDTMAEYPWIFEPMQVALVRASEKGGMLDQVFRQIGDYVEHEMSVRSLIKRETLYPKIVLFVLMMVQGRPGVVGGFPAIGGLFLGSMDGKPYSGMDYLWDTVGFGLSFVLPILLCVCIFRLFLFNVPGIREGWDFVQVDAPRCGQRRPHVRRRQVYPDLRCAGPEWVSYGFGVGNRGRCLRQRSISECGPKGRSFGGAWGADFRRVAGFPTVSRQCDGYVANRGDLRQYGRDAG